MQYSNLKNTNLTVSRIGVGCWQLGGQDWGNFSEKETMVAVSKAIDLGINFFDTADVYGLGKSEELLSKALGSKRKDMIISTKVGVNWEKNQKKGRVKTFYDSRPERIYEAVEDSLRRLRIDSIPLYFLHWPDNKTPFEETIKALEDCLKAGKIQNLGLSNFTLDQIEEINKIVEISAIQIQYSLLDKTMEENVQEFCRRRCINIITFGSLGQGLLTGKYNENTKFDINDNRSRLKHFKKEELFRYLPLINKIRSLSDKYGVSTSEIALRWVLENPNVSASLVGIKSSEQLKENANTLEWEIEKEDLIYLQTYQD